MTPAAENWRRRCLVSRRCSAPSDLQGFRPFHAFQNVLDRPPEARNGVIRGTPRRTPRRSHSTSRSNEPVPIASPVPRARCSQQRSVFFDVVDCCELDACRCARIDVCSQQRATPIRGSRRSSPTSVYIRLNSNARLRASLVSVCRLRAFFPARPTTFLKTPAGE